MLKGLLKEGEKNPNKMNNKMAINTYLSTMDSKKEHQQTSRTETESQRPF